MPPPTDAARADRRRAAARATARDAVADVLRALRERAGMSQEKLGELAALHRTYVGGYERSERRLTIEAVEQVLRALGVSWAEFGAAMDERVRRPRQSRPAGAAPPAP